METEKSLRPNQLSTWQKFCRNKLALAGLILILLVSVLSILGYLITPDNTPGTNDQFVELAGLPPGSKVTFFVERENTLETGWLKAMFIGKATNARLIPIDTAYAQDSQIYIKPYQASHIQKVDLRKISGNDVKNIDLFLQERLLTRHFMLGTDKYGRDLLSRIIIGGRISLSVGLISVLMSVIIGILLGALAGYYRGWVDDAIMWIVNVTWSVPTLLMVIAITLVLGKGFWQIFVAVGLTMWVEVARIVRGQVLSIREKDYIEACRAMGFNDFRIIAKHIIPNTIGAVTVISAANFASAILIEAGLSFLGIGIPPPMPSWGSMIKDHYGFIILDKAYLAIIPGVAIMMLTMAFSFVGNGLRDAFDNRSDII